MGCKAYTGKDVQTGLGGYELVQPPKWTGWRRPIWANLFAAYADEYGWVSGVVVFGWDDPYSGKPKVLEFEEFSPEDQQKLLGTIESNLHFLFEVKQ